MQPVIRQRIGDFVLDPIYIWNAFVPEKHKLSKRVYIPIYYLSLNYEDHDVHDGILYSYLHTARKIIKASANISVYMKPYFFFGVSPFGVMNPEFMRARRTSFASVEKNILFEHGGKTFLQDEFMPFMFDRRSLKHMWYELEMARRERYESNMIGGGNVMPAKDINPSNVLTQEVLEKHFFNVELDYYYNASTWEGYSHFAGEMGGVKKEWSGQWDIFGPFFTMWKPEGFMTEREKKLYQRYEKEEYYQHHDRQYTVR